MDGVIPADIAHLDFDPEVKEQENDVELRECNIKPCTNVATWVARVNCCKYNAYFCDRCKRSVTRVGAICRPSKCGKNREARWFTNWRRI